MTTKKSSQINVVYPVVIGNVSREVTHKDLKKFLLDRGHPLIRVKIAYKTVNGEAQHLGFATADMGSESHQKKMIQDLDGQLYFGTRLRCKVGERKEEDEEKYKKKKEKSESAKDGEPPRLDFLPWEVEKMYDYKFLFVDFESACSIEGGIYRPCEVSLVRFSIRDGEIEHYHKFIDPGEIPLGGLGSARFNSDHIHGIPYADFELAEKDYKKIWNEMVKFARGKEKEVPTIFAKGISLEKALFKLMAEEVGVENVFSELLLEVSDIILHLHHIARHSGYYNPKHFVVTPEDADKDYLKVRNFQFDNKCPWHNTLNSKLELHCALGDIRGIIQNVRDCAKELWPQEKMTVAAEKWVAQPGWGDWGGASWGSITPTTTPSSGRNDQKKKGQSKASESSPNPFAPIAPRSQASSRIEQPYKALETTSEKTASVEKPKSSSSSSSRPSVKSWGSITEGVRHIELSPEKPLEKATEFPQEATTSTSTEVSGVPDEEEANEQTEQKKSRRRNKKSGQSQSQSQTGQGGDGWTTVAKKR